MQKIQSGNQVVMKPNGNRHDARNDVIAKDERDCITKRVQKKIHGRVDIGDRERGGGRERYRKLRQFSQRE